MMTLARQRAQKRHQELIAAGLKTAALIVVVSLIAGVVIGLLDPTSRDIRSVAMYAAFSFTWSIAVGCTTIIGAVLIDWHLWNVMERAELNPDRWDRYDTKPANAKKQGVA